MAKFTDKLGRAWEFDLTAGDLPRLRAAGMDLSAAYKDVAKFTDLLSLDPEALGAGLWVLVRAQAEPLGVTPESFADGFNGPTVEAATDAVIEALVDFRHRGTVAPAVKKKWAETMRAIETATIKAVEAVDVGSISNASAGPSPEPSASTPAG